MSSDSDSDTSIGLDETDQLCLVDKLLQYGDSFLDEEEYNEMKKKRKKKTKISLQKQNNSDNLNKVEDSGRKRKKKKSKSNDNICKETEEGSLKKRNKSNKLQTWSEDLGLDQISNNVKNDEIDIGKLVQTDHKKQKRKIPEVIVFEDRKKKKKKAETAKTQDGQMEEFQKGSGSGVQMSLKDARREVRDFGISGFAYDDKKQLEVRRAIKLGAKPPKKDYVNYKKFMEMQKQKKEDEKKQRELERQLGYKVAKKSSGKRNPLEGKLKRFGFWSDPTLERSLHGQIGKYKDGVQILRKADIDAIKKTKVKRM